MSPSSLCPGSTKLCSRIDDLGGSGIAVVVNSYGITLAILWNVDNDGVWHHVLQNRESEIYSH